MGKVVFEQETFAAAYNGKSVVLLPKEYALLQYMHDHAGRTLKREQLLDAVWPMESPVDRTVDDHVYRLRKKLEIWGRSVKIETVRGAGYRFVIEASGVRDDPLKQVPSFSEGMQEIASGYLRYGRGDALLTLMRHKDVLGYEAEPSFQLFTRFLEGDLRFLVEEGDVPFRERAFLLLYVNQFIHPQENRRYVEAAIGRKLLPPNWQYELEYLTIIPLLLDWGDYSEARRRLDALKADIERNGWNGLAPFAANLELEFALCLGRREEIEASIREAEERLRKHPYQREQGQFNILKGIAAYPLDSREGLRLMDRGVEVLKETRFLPHLMNGIHTANHFGRKNDWEDVRQRYTKEWERLSRRIGLDEIKDKIDAQLKTNMGSL